MQLGKPVIVGQAKIMKEFVETMEIGYVIDETSPENFAQAVLGYYHNKESEDKRIQANCDKIKTDYLWEKTVRPMLERYMQFDTN